MNLEDTAPLDEVRLNGRRRQRTDTLSSIDPGVPQVPKRWASSRACRRRASSRTSGQVVFDRLCCACHGFSVLATGARRPATHAAFRCGAYPSVWKDNAARLGIDLAAIEGVFLSHWHFDHSGGFPDVVAAIAEARREHGLSPPFVDLHPDRPDQRGVLLPTGMMMLLPEEPRFEQIEAAGGRLIRHDQPHTLSTGSSSRAAESSE